MENEQSATDITIVRQKYKITLSALILILTSSGTEKNALMMKRMVDHVFFYILGDPSKGSCLYHLKNKEVSCLTNKWEVLVESEIKEAEYRL